MSTNWSWYNLHARSYSSAITYLIYACYEIISPQPTLTTLTRPISLPPTPPPPMMPMAPVVMMVMPVRPSPAPEKWPEEQIHHPHKDDQRNETKEKR